MAEKEISAVGVGVKEIINFIKAQVEIARSLAVRPYNHKEVEKFVFSLMELQEFTGFLFEEIGVNTEELKEILTDAYLETSVHYWMETNYRRLQGDNSLADSAMASAKTLAEELEKALLALERMLQHDRKMAEAYLQA